MGNGALTVVTDSDGNVLPGVSDDPAPPITTEDQPDPGTTSDSTGTCPSPVSIQCPVCPDCSKYGLINLQRYQFTGVGIIIGIVLYFLYQKYK